MSDGRYKVELKRIGLRIGLGEDSHHIRKITDEVKKDRKLKLLHVGGVLVDGYYSPDSNSDGDAVIHATFNAIASSVGLYPVGYYFKGEMDSSRPILLAARQILDDNDLTLLNLVISIEGKEPKIFPIIPKIKENYSEVFGISPDRIGVMATSGENLSDYGRGLGYHVIVTCLVFDNPDVGGDYSSYEKVEQSSPISSEPPSEEESLIRTVSSVHPTLLIHQSSSEGSLFQEKTSHTKEEPHSSLEDSQPKEEIVASEESTPSKEDTTSEAESQVEESEVISEEESEVTSEEEISEGFFYSIGF